MNGLITTVTLNAAIDKTYFVPVVTKGKVMRVGEAISSAGGKGVNVARVLRQLGHEEIAATGFAGGNNGKFIAEQVADLGIEARFVEIAGETRICLNVIDESDGSSTELLEAGPVIDELQLEVFRLRLRELASRSKIIVMSGSLPRGLRPDTYAELIRVAAAEGAEVFLDASGSALREGLAANPSFIKPNEEEVRPWAQDGTDVASAVELLMRQGVPNVVVTLGPEGAIAGVNGRLYKVRIPKMKVVSTVGCGDAFVAGFAFGRVRGWSAEECLRHAAAAGSANALSRAAGDVRIEEHRRILKEVQVSEWQA